MVAVLVLLSLAAFLLLDWLLVRRQRVRETTPVGASLTQPVPAAGPAIELPSGMFFHPGHTWARPSPDGLVAVGSDDFAPGFVGKVVAVEVPRVGTRLRQGEPAWTLISRRGRRLTQVMPVEGEVVEVNRDVLQEPEILQRSPYRLGWVLRVRPRRLHESLSNLLRGSLARTWMEAVKSRVTTRLSPAIGVVATDGGAWIAAFGDQLDDDEWEALKHELFPSAEPSTEVE